MKKIQCEVCGSTEIKKISDDLFECQSCGIQYEKSEIQKLLVEITGEVKIDHTEDAEKMLVRARQFEEKGDIQKAKEYYERALDYEPENAEAHGKLEEIDLAENLPPEVEDNVFIVEKDIESEKATENFLKFLMHQDNIVSDIYKEIEIISVEEKYYPFIQIQGRYSGQYTGTAVYVHREPFTDWKVETKYIDGKRYEKRVPFTNYRDIEDPKPVDGFCVANCTSILSVSKEFNSFFTSVSPKKFDEYVKNSKDHIDEYMLKDFERFLTGEISKINESMILFEMNSSVEETDNLSYYKGLPIEAKELDAEWMQRASSCQLDYAGNLCIENAKSKIPGKFSRDVNVNYGADYEESKIIYFPAQIIEYVYKGDFHKAIVSLVKKYNAISATYPYSLEQEKITSDSEEKLSTASNQYGTMYLGGALSMIGIVAFLPSLVYDKAKLCIGAVIVGVLLMLENVIRRHLKVNKIKNTERNASIALENARVQELKRESDVFFENYTDVDHINKAKEAVKSISTYSSDITKISKKYSG